MADKPGPMISITPNASEISNRVSLPVGPVPKATEDDEGLKTAKQCGGVGREEQHLTEEVTQERGACQVDRGSTQMTERKTQVATTK